jgi:hypothetical protein
MTETATSPELEALLAGCLLALEEEMGAVRDQLEARGLREPVSVNSGVLVDTTRSFVYEWQLPIGRHDARPDDAVRVTCEAGEATGFVASLNPHTRRLRVATADWLGRAPVVATLEFDPTWLLRALYQRLEGVLDKPTGHQTGTLLRLFGRVPPVLGRGKSKRGLGDGLNRLQKEAIERILGSEVQFVWGPPGTGKTRLLGNAVAELSDGGRVLVAAVTNGAVDEAARRVAEALGRDAVRRNRIVRVGAGLSSTGDPRLSLEAAVERRLSGSTLAGTITDLECELALLKPSGRPELSHRARLHRALGAARHTDSKDAVVTAERAMRDLQLQELLTLREADVVLTTFARLALWDELAALRFDALVIDEASTAPLPYIAFAATRASGRAVAIGDFQQLPAVVASRGDAASRWLSRDLFREAGIVVDDRGESALPSPRDRLCAMLDEQYRMAPPIRRLVSELFYGDRLRDAPEVALRQRFSAPLILIDTEELRPRVERAEGSRCNMQHITLLARLLEVLAGQGIDDVAVVAPYRLQARKLREAVRAQLGRAAPGRLEISTIHRFQGREKSVLVFDTVDAPPGVSWFLSEGKNPDLPRLLNVALSRAREALILVGGVAGLRRTLPPDALVNRILERVAVHGSVVGATALSRHGGLLSQPGTPEGDPFSAFQ